MKCTKESMRLYAVTDRSWLDGTQLYDQVEAALKGGATFIQLREKNMSDEEYLQEACKIRELCRRYEVPFVINDRTDIAVKADADGVHVGQKDMNAAEARKILGPDKIVGVSARTVEQALKAEAEGADYLGSGAVFSTSTKKDACALERSTLKAICEAVSIPVVAIGGITKSNILELSGNGLSGVAVVSALFAHKDVEAAAADLRKLSEEMVRR